MGSHRVRHDWSDLACTHAPLPWEWNEEGFAGDIANAHHYLTLLSFLGRLRFLLSCSEVASHDCFWSMKCERWKPLWNLSHMCLWVSHRLIQTQWHGETFHVLSDTHSRGLRASCEKMDSDRRGGKNRVERDCGDSVEHMGGGVVWGPQSKCTHQQRRNWRERTYTN